MYKETVIAETRCDTCKSFMGDHNTNPESEVHFCTPKCEEKYYYEKDKVALLYLPHITSKREHKPEFYSWKGNVYYDYPYETCETEPAKVIYVFKMDDVRRSGTVNNLLLILQDMKYGSIRHFNMHQYDNEHNHKENAYTENIVIDSNLLVSLLRSQSDFDLLNLYLENFRDTVSCF